VQFRAGGNALREFGLDVHVDVFERGLPLEFSGFDFFADGVEAANDGVQFTFLQHADFVEHLGVRHGAEDVVPPQPPVEGNGFGELRDIGADFAREASAAGDGRFLFHAAIVLTQRRGDAKRNSLNC
jgi:hypothetical protein